MGTGKRRHIRMIGSPRPADVAEVHVEDTSPKRVDDALSVVLVVLYVTGLANNALEADLKHGFEDRDKHA